jgi:hypothetical protein
MYRLSIEVKNIINFYKEICEILKFFNNRADTHSNKSIFLTSKHFIFKLFSPNHSSFSTIFQIIWKSSGPSLKKNSSLAVKPSECSPNASMHHLLCLTANTISDLKGEESLKPKKILLYIHVNFLYCKRKL